LLALAQTAVYPYYEVFRPPHSEHIHRGEDIMKPRRLRLAVEELEGRVLLSAVLSSNWSGYAAMTSLVAPQAGAVTSVAGNWSVPTVTGSRGSYSAIWVGIDGYSSPTVEQIGTEQYITSTGKAAYVAWYEMYPANPVYLDTFGFNISPGDSISASVSYSSALFSLQIANTSQNTSFSTQQTLATAQRSSAEWIVEAPSSFFGPLPLANFGTAKFSNASATINGATGPIDSPSSANTAINMVSGGKTIATTSSLTDSGATSSFTVTFTGSSSTGGGGSNRKHGPDVPANTIPATPVVVVILPSFLPAQPALLPTQVLQPPVNALAVVPNVVPPGPAAPPQSIRYDAAISGIGFAPLERDAGAQEIAPGMLEQAPPPDEAPADPAVRPESVSSLGLAAGDATVEAVSSFFATPVFAGEQMGGLTVDGHVALDITAGAGLALLVLGLNLQPPIRELVRTQRERPRRLLSYPA
jgi:hypothetical protein